VYLDGIQDPGNAGTLLRTAAAAGIQHVAASTGTVFLWAPKVLRAAMGAHFAVSIYEDVPPECLVTAYDAERIAADAGGGEPLYETSWACGRRYGCSALRAGDLARSLRDCAAPAKDPIASAVESLNVGAAAAVCLFEQRRRREQGKP